MNHVRIPISWVLLAITLLVCVAPSVDLEPAAMRARHRTEQALLVLAALVMSGRYLAGALLRLSADRAFRFRSDLLQRSLLRMSLPEAICAFLC